VRDGVQAMWRVVVVAVLAAGSIGVCGAGRVDPVVAGTQQACSWANEEPTTPLVTHTLEFFSENAVLGPGQIGWFNISGVVKGPIDYVDGAVTFVLWEEGVAVCCCTMSSAVVLGTPVLVLVLLLVLLLLLLLALALAVCCCYRSCPCRSRHYCFSNCLTAAGVPYSGGEEQHVVHVLRLYRLALRPEPAEHSVPVPQLR
jgi:hypothetical protein